MKKAISVILVLVVVAILVVISFENGIFSIEKNDGKTVVTSETDASTTTTVATAEPSSDATIMEVLVDGQKCWMGKEADVVAYVSNMTQQEWLDFAVIEDAHYGRVKENQTVITINDNQTVNAAERDDMDVLEVYRIGNAFCIEDANGKVNEDADRTKKVSGMSDSGIISSYCSEHEALISEAATDVVYPNAVNIKGTLKAEAGFDHELLRALVLVKFDVEANGKTVAVYAIEWKVCDCSANGNGGSEGGNPEKPSPAPTSAVTPSPEPTATTAPRPTNTHSVTPSPEPTATPSPEPTTTTDPRPTNTHSVTPSPEPTATTAPRPTNTHSVTPSPEPTNVHSNTPVPEATSTNNHSSTPAPESANGNQHSSTSSSDSNTDTSNNNHSQADDASTESGGNRHSTTPAPEGESDSGNRHS